MRVYVVLRCTRRTTEQALWEVSLGSFSGLACPGGGQCANARCGSAGKTPGAEFETLAEHRVHQSRNRLRPFICHTNGALALK